MNSPSGPEPEKFMQLIVVVVLFINKDISIDLSEVMSYCATSGC